MTRSRRDRSERAAQVRRRAWAVGTLALLALLGGGLAVTTLLGSTDRPASAEDAGMSSQEESNGTTLTLSADASATAAVEVPELAGRTLAEATVLLEAMGVVAEIVENAALASDAVGEARIVRSQEPSAGALLATGSAVRLTVASDAGASTPVVPEGLVVVIDPGHQARGDSSPEPVGPGSRETKPRVTGGTTGVETRVPEYEVVLQIATNLKQRLERAGIRVVMTRTTNDVNLSNAERAQIANEARAALFIRIHADGNVDSAHAGISTLHPGENQWTGPIVAPSQVAARAIHDAVISSTGAASRGVVARTDLTGFNWATVPTVLVECGFMTNPVEDRLLSSPHYQDKLAEGMTAGILEYVAD